ncbi:MAG: hypothetical protein OES32_08855 [Acidobacteriota bacterium]|nr:hypothetical protein [Acidobacteriota bacterium]MDH3523681.1 hypothetical protein [Acidobacteriota bacterium]
MTLLLFHAGATLAMVGLIWFVQLVHYPLFELASERRFAAFAAEHQKRTAWVVVPLMLLEGATAVALLLAPPLGLGRALPFLGALLLGLIWLSTAGLQVPQHRRLARSRDVAAMRRLVKSNWLRTAGWTLRGALALELVRRAF